MKMMVMGDDDSGGEGSIDYMGYQPRPTLMTARTSGGWICRREERGKGRRRSGLYVTSNNQIAINSSNSTEGREGGEGKATERREVFVGLSAGGGVDSEANGGNSSTCVRVRVREVEMHRNGA